MNPQPKKIPVRLKPKAKTQFKRLLYLEAWRQCETCDKPIPLTENGKFNVFTCAHLSHIKSYGAGGGDTKENCLIECYDCHINRRHGPQWGKK